jgi:hypothetical protein
MIRLPSDTKIFPGRNGGWCSSAYSVGAFSEGKTPNEAYRNLLDALRELQLGARDLRTLGTPS